MATKDYALGHGEVELRRLDSQADLLTAGTHALLREAGVTQGMTVLDLGTGTGRVAMLLAELVGSQGHVVGEDSSTGQGKHGACRQVMNGAMTGVLQSGRASRTRTLS